MKIYQQHQKPRARETGQGILEYMIVIALVGLAVVAIVNMMQPAIGAVFSDFVDRANVAPPNLVGFTRVPPTPSPTPDPNPILTITIVGNGVVQTNPNPPVAGGTVSLTAQPAPGWEFAGWGDDLSGTDNPISLLLDTPKTVSALFVEQAFTLNVSVFGNGGVTLAPNQPAYSSGQMVTLSANPGASSLFIAWSGDATGSSNPLQLVMDGDKNVQAIFQLSCYTLTTAASPSSWGTVSVNPAPNCGTQYEHGSVVTLTAVPAAGRLFSQWSGSLSATSNPVNLTMNGPRSVMGNFAEIHYTLTTNVVGNGTVSASPSLPSYPINSSAQLTAVPNTGATFTGWSGDLTGTANPATVTFNNNKVVTANFQNICYLLNTAVSPLNAGNVTMIPTSSPGCSPGRYHYNQAVALTANAAAGYTFNSWSGGASGSSPSTSVTITGDTSVTAVFDPDESAILVVGNPASLTATDTAVRNRLQILAYGVILLDDNNANGYNPGTAALIVVSPSVNAATYGSAFNNTAVPLILMRRDLAANLRLGNTPNLTTNRRQVDMVAANSGHPLAAGKSGRITIYGSNQNIGNIQNLGSGAVRIAYAYGSTSRFTIVGYPLGATMTSGTAPANRVGFFLERADLYTADGWALFDAAVNWAAGN